MISGLRVKRADGTWTDGGGADLEGFWPPPTTTTNYTLLFYSWDWITTIPPHDTSSVTNMSSMFVGCSSLTTIPPLDTSSVTNTSGMFQGCSSLTTVVLNGLGADLSVADTNMGADALNALFDGLATVTDGRTVDITNTPGAATCDRTIATNKGWTVTG